MNDFDFDVKEKKRIAAGARAKRNGSRTRWVSLPSDNLTPAQRKKLNGEVKVYKIGERITWAEFRSYPEEMQIEYLKYFRDRFNLNKSGFCRLMGMSGGAWSSFMFDNKALAGIAKRGAMSTHELAAFKAWLNDSVVVEEKPVVVEKPKVERKPEVPYFAHTLKMGEFSMEGTGVEISQTLFGIFRDARIRVHFTFEAIVEEEPVEEESVEEEEIEEMA